MVKQVTQPSLMQLESDKLEEFYGIKPSLAEEFTVRMPFINIKTNEIAIFKVKDEKDIPAIKAGMEKRAKDVQNQFEHYLQDQYENAKNFKIVTNGHYVLFVISDSSADIIKVFHSFFQK
ncbi:DUF4358 domain-containing protein [Gorillibacterium massiliense]|uniref:DUF4358 domain-containing protein n=1 Tax=Gorillibacterium massiliense TaxID=1280390 RepID=UPI001EE360F2|nr:DUF4358 domain-containing protein [Gorillibacterium massiliense]